MKAPAFHYVRPRSLPEAAAVLAEHGDGARILAGGQSLMPALNMRLSAPQVLVDLNKIEALAGISLEGERLRIGAMTRHADLERSPLVAGHAPLIAQAIPHIAHPAIRNRGTFGGSLCFADPAAELPACVVALGAKLLLQSTRGSRKVDAGEFFRGLYRTALSSDEILVAAEIPIAASAEKFGFAELSRRHGDYAIVGVCARATMQDGVFDRARLVYFGVGDAPVVGKAAAAALQGGQNRDETRRAACEALGRDLDPPSDFHADAAMRVHLAKVLSRRILESFAE